MAAPKTSRSGAGLPIPRKALGTRACAATLAAMVTHHDGQNRTVSGHGTYRFGLEKVDSGEDVQTGTSVLYLHKHMLTLLAAKSGGRDAGGSSHCSRFRYDMINKEPLDLLVTGMCRHCWRWQSGGPAAGGSRRCGRCAPARSLLDFLLPALAALSPQAAVTAAALSPAAASCWRACGCDCRCSEGFDDPVSSGFSMCYHL